MRMRLLAREGKIDAAVADLRVAYQEILEADGLEKAAAEMFGAIDKIELPQIRPHTTLDLLADAFIKSKPMPNLSKDVNNQLADLLFFSLRTIRNKQAAGHAPSVLRVIPLLKEDYHFSVARQALTATVQDADLQKIRAVIGDGSVAAQIVAAESLAKLQKLDAKAALENLLNSPNERVRLSAARGLAGLAQPSGLTALVELLNAKDLRVRSRSVQMLRALTSQKFGYSSFLEGAARTIAVESWRKWVSESGANAELKLPIPDIVPMFG